MAEEKTLAEQTPETSSVLNARVFTMPEAYRHGKEAKLVEPKKESTQPVKPTPPPEPVKPVVPVKKPVPKKHTYRALIIAGVCVLLALVVGGYLLIRSAQQQPVVPETPVVPIQPVVQPTIEQPSTQEPVLSPETQNPFQTQATSGKDSDSDGLTDVEENLIYQTNPNLPDTDADGFLDGNEVFHRYNPNGTAPGTLHEAGVVQLFERFGVRLSFPSVWSTEPESEFSDVFQSTTGETITARFISVSDPSMIQSTISSWVTEQGGQEQLLKTESKTGYELYLSQNKQQALLVLNGSILEFVYALGEKTTMDYAQTFQMVLNSVELFEAV